ncbi:MAG: hypothetical protein QXU60_03045 [Sulfolobales archaeon]
MSESLERSILSGRAEDLSPRHLEKLPIVPPLKSAYNGILESVRNVSEGVLNSAWFSVIGLYGSGKTFLLRRVAHEALRKHENVIPIYFYLGNKDEILLFTSLGKYIGDVEEYIKSNGKIASTKTHGEPGLWGKRLEALKEVYEKVKGEKEKIKYDVELFFNAMRELNRKGYYPLIVLDEFERVVYTGEGISDSNSALLNFDYLSQHFLELTRGHLFQGVGVLALTEDLPTLVRKAKREGFPQVSQVERVRVGDYEKLEIASPNIVFNGKYSLNWNYDHLNMLCKELGILLPQDLINAVSRILPTPRAIININNRARELGIEKVDRKSIYKLIEEPLETLTDSMKKYETKSGNPLLYPTAKWDEWFKTLLEEGYYAINRNELPVIGKLIRERGLISKRKEEKGEGRKEDDEKRMREIGRWVIDTLVDCGLYDKVGKVYYLKRELMAYLLRIERLPSGEYTDLSRVLEIIGSAVEERRERSRNYRRRTSKSAKEKSS